MRKSFYLLFLLGIVQQLNAQVPKNLLVEHFTNTNCSACKSRNPGFYTNLSNQGNNAFHLSIHSSIPYTQCLLYQQNPAPSDARAFAHAITGTPSLAMNGIGIPPSSNYNASSLFTPFLNQTSPISIELQQQKYGADSMKVRVIVRTEATHSLSNQQLWVGVAEDTVNYTGPNGETAHYDVFRAQLAMEPITIPAGVGGVVIKDYTLAANPIWDFAQLFAFATVENMSSLSITQAAITDISTQNVITSVESVAAEPLEGIDIFPNPAKDQLTIKVREVTNSRASLYTVSGILIKSAEFNQQMDLNLTDVASGIYFIKIENENGMGIQKVTKQ